MMSRSQYARLSLFRWTTIREVYAELVSAQRHEISPLVSSLAMLGTLT